MIEHYDAFISYRHAKLDTEIAESIQHDLEHFRIPRAVRRSSGKKRIDRIFRDREELPITSDLNDNIMFALKNSDFLIVICSERTKESSWVEREIEAFVEFHDRNHVLTVLADGEPENVIPEVLRYTEEAVIKEDGSIALETVEMEPLSCDYRMKRSAARKKELPRLAASILGCSYDELILRRRQYRMRQMTAAASVLAVVMAGAAVYMYRTGQKIQKNLEAAQINQSVYLANASGERLENNDPITATLLALEALPKTTGARQERPVTAEAVKALGEAIWAYVQPDSFQMFNGAANLRAGARFQMDYEIREYIMDTDHETLIALDNSNNNNLVCWDMASGARKYEVSGEEYIFQIESLDDDAYICKKYGRLEARSFEDNSLLWSWDSVKDMYYSGDFDISGDRSLIAMYSGEGEVVLLDAKDGSEERKIELPQLPESVEYDVKMSPDMSRVCLFDKGVLSDIEIACLDLETEGCVTFGEESAADGSGDLTGTADADIYAEENLISDLVWLDEDRIAVLIKADDMAHSMRLGQNLFSVERAYYLAVCFDAGTGEILWQEEIPCTLPATDKKRIYKTEYRNASGSLAQGLMAAVGNQAVLLNAENGEKAAGYEMSGAIVAVDVSRTGGFEFVSDDGGIGRALYSRMDNSSYIMTRGMERGSHTGCFFYGSLDYEPDILVDSSDRKALILYSYDHYDPEYEAFTGCRGDSEEEQYYNMSAVFGDRMLVLLSGEGCCVRLFDLDTQAAAADIRLPITSYSAKILGVSEKADVCWIYGSDSDFEDHLYAVGLEDGTYTEVMDPEGRNWNDPEYACISGNEIVFAASDADNVILFYDPASKETRVLELDIPAGNYVDSMRAPLIAPDGGKILLALSDGAPVLADIKTGDTAILEEGGMKMFTSFCAWNEDSGSLVMCSKTDGQLACFDRQGARAWSREIQEGEVQGAVCCGDNVIILRGSELSERYSIHDGKYLGQIDFGEIPDPFDGLQAWNGGDLFYLRCSDVLFMISREDWKVHAYVHNNAGYDPQRRRVYTYSTVPGYCQIGAFPEYTVEDLIRKGKEFTGDMQLDESTKEYYGIS